ncbi:hypothetical protein EDD15DRAFT_224466 [Pisolithus albus]|nr:hypothetical protein EDD15DRAFT_224466 [Pisolithus albus]
MLGWKPQNLTEDYILVLRETGRLFASRNVARHREGLPCRYPRRKWCRDRYSSSPSHVPYDHEETVSNRTDLRLAKRSQHSADQFLHDKSPTDLFQSIFHERWSSKLYFPPRYRDRNTSGASPVYRCMPSVRRIGGREIWSIEINGIGRGLLCRSVVVTRLGKQHPHALFLDRTTSHDSHRHLALAIKAFEGGVVVVSHDFPE